MNQVPSTAGMTQQSIDNYNAKKREAETEIIAAQRVIDNGDATAQQISDEKHRVDNALTALNQAKHDLTADTHALEQAVQQLNRTGTTTGKKPASITAYNNSIRALQSDLTSAKNSANAIIQKPIRTVQEVQSALTNVNRVNERLTQAINQLVPLADNSALRTAKTKLDEEINKSVTTDGMTQSSIQAYENAKRAGQTESTNAQNVINNGDATDQQIAAEKAKVEEKYNSLKQAIAGLTPDLAPLQAAKTQLQNDIDQPTSTTGMTSASVATFNEKLSAARTKIQEIDRVLASHPDVATIRQNVTAAKTAVEQALNNVNSAKHALNGTQNLNNAKQAAITAINGASDLNQKQKDALKAQANGAQRVSNAQDVQRNATELNTAMGTLKHAIADKTNTLASSKYVNADSTKQNDYTTKVTNAEHIISGTPTVVTTPSEVTAAANQVNSAKQELNGDERLRVAKQNANTAIDALTQLNTPQKAKLKEQVGQANRLEDVQTVQTNGQALNNAMKGLRDSIANETTVKE